MKYSVLIVEDDPAMQNLLKDFIGLRQELEIKGVIATIEELREIILNDAFDLMFLDVNLDGESSIELIEEIDNLPCIIFTTGDEKYAPRAFDVGAIDYLVKPFSSERFNKAINRFLERCKNGTESVIHKSNDKKIANKYEKSSLSQKRIDEIANELIDYIETTKVYTNSKITMQAIAKELDVSTHHLSQVINQKLNKTYYEFINEYRIEEVKKFFLNPANNKKSILDLCYAAGFNSKSVFNNAFKRLENMTPGQYRRKIKKRKE